MHRLILFVILTLTYSKFEKRQLYTVVQKIDANFSCNISDEKCSYHGICQEDGKDCICNEGYISSNYSENKCSYEQKSAQTAFFFEFFFGTMSGAGYFYLNLAERGIAQLTYFWLPCVIFLCMNFISLLDDSDLINESSYKCIKVYKIIFKIIIILWILGIIIWWIYALIQISSGSLSDGNNMPIISYSKRL